MAEPRIQPLNPPYEPELDEVFGCMMPPGVPPIKLFRTLGRNSRILKKFYAGSLLDRGAIDRRDRELVILRTCARCGAEYEWGVHVAFFSERFGINADQVAATFLGSVDDPVWSDCDALLIRMVDELHDTAAISDELWALLAAEWAEDQLIELIVLAGFYHTVSFIVNGLEVALENGAPRFPAR